MEMSECNWEITDVLDWVLILYRGTCSAYWQTTIKKKKSFKNKMYFCSQIYPSVILYED